MQNVAIARPQWCPTSARSHTLSETQCLDPQQRDSFARDCEKKSQEKYIEELNTAA